jgi:hypothetical protein
MKQTLIDEIHFDFHKIEIKSWLASPHLIAGGICLFWLALLSFTISSLIHSF